MDAFTALADGTRRRILEALATGEHSVGSLALRFDISQPAASQHLRVLREAGLARVRADAQRRLYRADPEGFRVVALWLERTRRAISDQLDGLERHLDNLPEDRHD